MTLLIDKSKNNTRLILTATESYSGFTGAILQAFNEATNVELEISLPDDSSAYPDRYNEFNIPTSTLSGLTVGTYSYTIKSNEAIDIEHGILKVVDEALTPQGEVDSTYTFITPDDTADDFIVYQPQ